MHTNEEFQHGDDDENRERQEAEFEFVASAYAPDEAWVVRMGESTACFVHRKLELFIDSSSPCTPVDLTLEIPPSYPSDETSPLVIDASVMATDTSTSPAHRKIVMDSIPSLLQACRSAAIETVGTESVFVVFSIAEEWIEKKWTEIVAAIDNQTATRTISLATNDARAIVLGRKLIHSHHIIAKSKRKVVGDLAKEYELGGYFKIGWPGIIIIEGEEENCNLFCDEIRKMRWQYLVIRGEERETTTTTIMDVDWKFKLDKLRRFPLQMTELGEDQMSHLSELCREAGLEDLFRTSMKIYSSSSEDTNSGCDQRCDSLEKRYGTLVLVDHMNDPKGYTKWIRKACQSVGCQCAIVNCLPNDEDPANITSTKKHQKPLICVLLVTEEESSIKQLLKRWRTTRIDVDSKGNPCLERMMNVLAEGELQDSKIDQNELWLEYSSGNGCQRLSKNELKNMLMCIGGSTWKKALEDAIRNRYNSASSEKTNTKNTA